jgi:predicted membrane channel-forming protein YqfA (hemolysin III family)
MLTSLNKNNMSENSSSSSFGLGTILFIIFLTLKLGGWGVVATWSWWWIFSPLWIPLLIVLGIGIVALIVHILK